MNQTRNKYKKIDSWLVKIEATLSYLFQRQAYWVVDLDNIAYGPLASLKQARKMAIDIGFGRLITSELTVLEWKFLLASGENSDRLIKRRYNIRTGRLRR